MAETGSTADAVYEWVVRVGAAVKLARGTRAAEVAAIAQQSLVGARRRNIPTAHGLYKDLQRDALGIPERGGELAE